jgi:hypothetical protein
MVHLNGTSKQGLLDQQVAIHDALGKVLEALRNATPHGRDYYTQDEGSFLRASTEHQARVATITKMQNEVFDIAFGITQQGK